MKRLGICCLISTLLNVQLASAASLYISDVPKKRGVYYQNTVGYYLPKNLVQVSITYSVFEVTNPTNSKNTFNIRVFQPPAVSTVAVRDPSLKFYVHLDHLNDWLTSTTLGTLNVGDDAILQGVNATFDDRTAAIVENTVNTAVNIGKLAAAAGTIAGGTYIGDITLQKTVDIDNDVVRTSFVPATNTTVPVTAGVPSTSSPTSSATSAAQTTATTTTTSHGATTTTTVTGPSAGAQIQGGADFMPVVDDANIKDNPVDPASTLKDSKGTEYTFKRISLRSIDYHQATKTMADITDVMAVTSLLVQKKIHTTSIDEIVFPSDIDLYLEKYVSATKVNMASTLLSKDKFFGLLQTPCSRFKGLIVRAPGIVPMQIRVQQDGQPYTPYMADVMLSQAGTFSYIPIKKRFFSIANTSVTIGTAGGVKTIGSSHTSPLETITSMLENISQNLIGLPLGNAKTTKK